MFISVYQVPLLRRQQRPDQRRAGDRQLPQPPGDDDDDDDDNDDVDVDVDDDDVDNDDDDDDDTPPPGADPQWKQRGQWPGLARHKPPPAAQPQG